MHHNLCEVIQFKAGQVVYLENTRSLHFLYIIRKGRLKRTIDITEEGVTEILNRGETFGFVSCLTGFNNIDTVVALTDCELLAIHSKMVINFFSHNKNIFFKIIQYQSTRLKTLDELFFKSKVLKNQTSALFAVKKEKAYKKEDEDGENKNAEGKEENQGEANPEINKESAEIKNEVIKPGEKNTNESKKAENPEKTDNDGTPSEDEKSVQNEADHVISEEELGTIRTEGQEHHELEKIDPEKTDFKIGEAIFRMGDEGDYFFVIEQGKVKISINESNGEKILAILGENDFFGEMSILNRDRRMANANCFEDCKLSKHTKETFLSALEYDLLSKIFKSIATRYYITLKRIVNLAIKNPSVKIKESLTFLIYSKCISINENSSFRFSLEEIKAISDSDLSDDRIINIVREWGISFTYGEFFIQSVPAFLELVKKDNIV